MHTNIFCGGSQTDAMNRGSRRLGVFLRKEVSVLPHRGQHGFGAAAAGLSVLTVLAGLVDEGALNEECIIPAPFDPRVRDAVARRVAAAARESGAARI